MNRIIEHWAVTLHPALHLCNASPHMPILNSGNEIASEPYFMDEEEGRTHEATQESI